VRDFVLLKPRTPKPPTSVGEIFRLWTQPAYEDLQTPKGVSGHSIGESNATNPDWTVGSFNRVLNAIKTPKGVRVIRLGIECDTWCSRTSWISKCAVASEGVRM